MPSTSFSAMVMYCWSAWVVPSASARISSCFSFQTYNEKRTIMNVDAHWHWSSSRVYLRYVLEEHIQPDSSVLGRWWEVGSAHCHTYVRSKHAGT